MCNLVKTTCQFSGHASYKTDSFPALLLHYDAFLCSFGLCIYPRLVFSCSCYVTMLKMFNLVSLKKKYKKKKNPTQQSPVTEVFYYCAIFSWWYSSSLEKYKPVHALILRPQRAGILSDAKQDTRVWFETPPGRAFSVLRCGISTR